MLTTVYVNKKQHRVYRDGELIGFILQYRGKGWIFATVSDEPHGTHYYADWEDALPVNLAGEAT